MFVDYDVNSMYASIPPSALPEQRMELGETYVNEASSYATEQDEVEFYWVKPAWSLTNWDYNASIYDWCVNKFGKPEWNVSKGYSRWTGSDGKFYFRDERDRTMFILKWS